MTEHVTKVIAEHLASLDEAAYKQACSKVTQMSDSMLVAASYTDSEPYLVLIAICRSFGMLWSGLDGPSQEAIPAFNECFMHSGLLLVAEMTGVRMSDPAEAKQILETMRKDSKSENPA